MSTEIRADRVSNAALRREFLRLQRDEGLTVRVLAERLDWYRGGEPDDSRVRAMLGLKLVRWKGRSSYQKAISWDNVGPICRAMGLIPAEIGY